MNNTVEPYASNAFTRPLTGRLVYILAIAAFFFTFFNLRCGTVNLAKVSGVNMAVGGKAELNKAVFSAFNDKNTGSDTAQEPGRKSLFGEKDSAIRLPVNYWALAALLSLGCAFAVSFVHRVKAYTVQMGFTGIALLSLILMLFTKGQYAMRMMKMDNSLAKQRNPFSEQIFGLQIAWAYWFVLGALLIGLFTAIMVQRKLKIELENEAAVEQFNPGVEEQAGEPG